LLNAAEIKPAIEAFGGKPDGAMIVLPDYLLDVQRQHVVALAAKNRIPDLYASNEASGGLLFYSSDWTDLYRRAASYVDQILKGAKPAELPIQQPTKFQLVINLKTAKALGLTVPPTLLTRADKVIE
jgi:putative tryptophan/tyrosine transport system substrate-binding protein